MGESLDDMKERAAITQWMLTVFVVVPAACLIIFGIEAHTTGAHVLLPECSRDIFAQDMEAAQDLIVIEVWPIEDELPPDCLKWALIIIYLPTTQPLIPVTPWLAMKHHVLERCFACGQKVEWCLDTNLVEALAVAGSNTGEVFER